MSFQPPTPGPLPSSTPPAGEPPRRARGRNVAIAAAAVLAATTIGAGTWVAAVGGKVDDRDATIASLRDDNDDLDQRASDLQDDANSAQDELDTADATVDSLAESLAATEAELADVEAELESVNADITTLEVGTPSTSTPGGPPPPLDPTDPRNDGVITDSEYSMLNVLLGEVLVDAPALTQEEAQDIADRACAVTSPVELYQVASDVLDDYWPDGSLASASGLIGGIAGAACIDRLLDIAG